MKILHVGPIKPMRDAAMGVNQSVRGLISGQVSIGLEVGLLPSVPMTQGRPIEGLAGVCRIEGPRRRHYNPWFISKDWIVHIREKFGEPDLVNFHSTYIPFQIALARQCRRLGWPYIVTPRGGMTKVAQSIKTPKKAISNTLFYRSFVKHATAIHTISESEAEQVRSSFAVKKIITVPNAVDDELFDICESLSPANLGSFTEKADLMLGFVGRIDVYIKGIDLLLNALAILKSQPNCPIVKLFIVGPFFTDKDKNYCLATIQTLGLVDTVKLVGPKYGKEKLSYLLACDAYIQTSRSEGMPMSVLEAMALGRPCLVTSGTGLNSIVCENGGWTCETESESIAHMILDAYNSRNCLKVIGKKMQDFVRLNLTWRNVAEKLIEEYAKILNQTQN